jgi:interferon gamma-inducible protein 30
LLLLLLLVPSSSSSSSNNVKKVTMSIYYESLCPFCADFIVNHLVKLFQTNLISIVNLRMVPWGNAWIKPDGTFDCQVYICFHFIIFFTCFCFLIFLNSSLMNYLLI